MEGDKSDSETSEFEQLTAESMSQISESLQEIQESIYGGDNSSIADQKIDREEKPSNMSWNVEEVEEGTLEFGDDGLVTAKGSNVSVCALESLPLKDHGIVYFELKLVDFPLGSVLEIGITQKTMAIGSFSVFKSAFSYMNIWGFFCRKGDVIGCGLKFGAGKMFITWNGKIERTVELSKLKCGDGTDQKLTVKLQQGKGCSVQLGHIAVTEDEDNCPF